MAHLLILNKDDITTSRLPKFIGALWAIWILRNEQVFRSRRPTLQSITHQLQVSENQHVIFVAQFDHTWNPRDLTTPPGFKCVNLGR